MGRPTVRLVPATEELLLALAEDRARFAALFGAPAPEGWPEFPEAVTFTLQHLRRAPSADRAWSMQLFVDEAVEGNNIQKSTGWAGPANPSVLIVDDDGPGDTQRVYAGALASLGIPYAIVERHVAAETMDDYDAVIWVSTLDRYDGQLDEDDRAEIASYLTGGGKLWLSSNRAVEAATLAEGGADFIAQWFGVEWVDIDSFYRPVSMVNADIFGSAREQFWNTTFFTVVTVGLEAVIGVAMA